MKSSIETPNTEEHVNLRAHQSQQFGFADGASRTEGISFREDGEVLAAALLEQNCISLFRKSESGHKFNTTPFFELTTKGYDFDYPHDIAFSLNDNGKLLAVAFRSGSLVLFERLHDSERYHPTPIQIINKGSTALRYTDGVGFLPPSGNVVAICNTLSDELVFFGKNGESHKFQLDSSPIQSIQGGKIQRPDGLAFSSCGRYVAITNHSANNVVVLAIDQNSFHVNPEPIQTICEPSMVFPHSVQFTPQYNHLLVTCAGANHVNFYAKQLSEGAGKAQWSGLPNKQLCLGHDELFISANTPNKEEGGGKGITMSNDLMAICRPETGISIYPYVEQAMDITFPFKIENKAFQPTPKYHFKEIRGKNYLLQKNTEIALQLNSPAAMIYLLCNGINSVSDIQTKLGYTYPNHPDLSAEVLNTLYSLMDSDAIVELNHQKQTSN